MPPTPAPEATSAAPLRHRAVITGMGPVSAIGVGREPFWQSLQAGHSGITRLTRFSGNHLKARHAAEIQDFSPAPWFAAHESKRWDRCTSLALVAAHLALQDAGWQPGAPVTDALGVDPERMGVSFGSALGGIADAEEQHTRFLTQGIKAVSRSLALQIYGGSAHSNIAIQFGLHGPSTTHSNSCASGNVALGEALRLIRHGYAEVMLAGAAEAPLCPLTFAAFDQIHTMSRWDADPPQRACRPFDTSRDGFVMGEGAACFVVERLDHALRRGARIYAELVGYSLTGEAFHMTIPNPEGAPLRRTMRAALADAGITPDQIDYVNAHASSTPQNDVNEAAQIATVFAPNPPPVSGTKAFTGHTLGAAGALECAICLLALEHGWLPPTLNHSQSDCAPLDYIPNQGRSAALRAILSNSFGFGGIDSSIVLRRMETDLG